MTIPRLNGWLDEAAPGLNSFFSGLQGLLRPDLPNQQALQHSMITDPGVVSAIQNMNHEERQAYIASLGLKNHRFTNNLMNMPLGDEAKLRDMKMQALGNASPDERARALVGIRTPEERAIDANRATSTGIDAKYAEPKMKADIAQSEAAARDASLRAAKLANEAGKEARKNELLKSYKTVSNLYANRDRLSPEESDAILSGENNGIREYFSVKDAEAYRNSQREFQAAQNDIQRQAVKDNKKLTFAQAMYSATGAGSLQAHAELQDPQVLAQTKQLSDLKKNNPQSYAQVIQQDPTADTRVNAYEGIQELNASNKAARTNKIVGPIKERLQKSMDNWSSDLSKAKKDKTNVDAINQTATVNVTDALQDLAAAKGIPVQVHVGFTSGVSHLLSANEKPVIKVQLTGEGFNTKEVPVSEAARLIETGQLSKPAASTQNQAKDPVKRATELHTQHPDWDNDKIVAQMKKEGYPGA